MVRIVRREERIDGRGLCLDGWLDRIYALSSTYLLRDCVSVALGL
jgi:hypothetical protein